MSNILVHEIIYSLSLLDNVVPLIMICVIEARDEKYVLAYLPLVPISCTVCCCCLNCVITLSSFLQSKWQIVVRAVVGLGAHFN